MGHGRIVHESPAIAGHLEPVVAHFAADGLNAVVSVGLTATPDDPQQLSRAVQE
jgi:hypothetical protein